MACVSAERLGTCRGTRGTTVKRAKANKWNRTEKGHKEVLPVFLSYLVIPVFASTSLRHNTVDVWGKCAYTKKKRKNRVVIFVLCIFYPNI